MSAIRLQKQRIRRKKRVRKKISGSENRPRLTVFRSGKHIYAQLIDDEAGKTIAAASTVGKELREKIKAGATKEAARTVGKTLAENAKSKGIGEVVFDRNGYLYHGRVKELAEGAREGGLKF